MRVLGVAMLLIGMDAECVLMSDTDDGVCVCAKMGETSASASRVAEARRDMDEVLLRMQWRMRAWVRRPRSGVVSDAEGYEWRTQWRFKCLSAARRKRQEQGWRISDKGGCKLRRLMLIGTDEVCRRVMCGVAAGGCVLIVWRVVCAM